MRLIVLFLFFLNLTLFGADKFFCPMHCEGAKTYEKAGTCPVCHMYLEKEPEPGAETGPLSSKDYRVDLTSKELAGQKDFALEAELTLRRTSDDTIVSELEERNGNTIEIYFTDQELTFMEALKMSAMKDGRFRFSRAFGKSGNYLIFAIFKPKDVREQIFPLALKVEVPKNRQRTISPVKPRPTNDKFGHYIIVSEDTTYFSREHTVMKSTLDKKKKDELRKKLPKPGKYKVFVQRGADVSLRSYSLMK